ncbi:hypothetical protein LENED_001598 [Lentinula edodes]|uniref:Uncharacterized protein n=1 Tax=Lentinula edodes TaxID=5353 RepID=A0A1Q3DZ14_LENED|nr:hypothetical protein LENED_001598 [Lentinula edodes]
MRVLRKFLVKTRKQDHSIKRGKRLNSTDNSPLPASIGKNQYLSRDLNRISGSLASIPKALNLSTVTLASLGL